MKFGIYKCTKHDPIELSKEESVLCAECDKKMSKIGWININENM